MGISTNPYYRRNKKKKNHIIGMDGCEMKLDRERERKKTPGEN